MYEKLDRLAYFKCRNLDRRNHRTRELMNNYLIISNKYVNE